MRLSVLSQVSRSQVDGIVAHLIELCIGSYYSKRLRSCFVRINAINYEGDSVGA